MISTNSKEEFVHVVCETIKEQANKSILKKGSFTFVLSGGRTPKNIFTELSTTYKNKIDWSKVHFFWLDERCVEATHKDSNYKLAFDNLISKLNQIGSIHRIKCKLDPKQAAKEYKEDLLKFFDFNEIKFDFILLGMGEDGHVASLFPNSKEVKLISDLVLETDRKYNGYKRITLGLNLINMCFYKMLLVKGEKKLKLLNSEDKSFPINKINEKNIVYLGL